MPNKPETRTRSAPSEQKLTPEEQCGANTKESTPCRNRKGNRTDHPGYGYCTKHGGNTEAGIKHAMREMGHDLARQIKADQGKWGGDRRDADIATLSPEHAMLEEMRRTAAFVRFLEERIGAWNLAPVEERLVREWADTPPRTRTARSPAMKEEMQRFLGELERNDPNNPNYLPPLMERDRNTGFTSFTDAREWLYLYREERAHLARVAKMCIDAGIAQRLVAIAEDQGRILASAIRAVLQALNLTPEQANLVPHIVPPILRAVASNQPIPSLAVGELAR